MRDDLKQLGSMLEVRNQGMVVVQVGLMTTLYFRGGHRAETQAAVLRCLNEYLRLAGASLKWSKDPSTFTFHRIASGRVPEPARWLAEIPEGAAWEFEYRGGDQPEAATPFSIEVVGRADRGKDELSYIKACLPMTFYTEHGGTFVDLVLAFCLEIRPFHGYGGLGILESPDESIASDYEPVVLKMARRFPGLEVDYPTSHIRYLRDGIKGTNWIVVVSDVLITKLNGMGGLRTQLSPEFSFIEYPGGIIIKAGPRPQIGDSEKGLIPKLYVQLARALKPIRITKHRMFHHGGPDRFDRPGSEAWLQRFDS